MAAYVALVTVKHSISSLLDYTGLVLSKYNPSTMELLQFAVKELNSYQEFVEGLNIRSRIRMEVPLEGFVDATVQFQETFSSKLRKALKQPEMMLGESDKSPYLRHGLLQCNKRMDLAKGSRNLENLRQVVHSFIDTLKKIKEECLKVQDEDEDEDEDEDLAENEALVNSGRNMVGLSDVYSELKRVIVSNMVEDLVVSIFGMTGIGKTTLAFKLYLDLDITGWFECYAWVRVGIEFQPEEITQAIQVQMGLDPHEMLTEGYLKKKLNGQRYFIVLDDVWDLELCQSFIESSFDLDINDGSRVLVTTTIQDDSLSCHLISMRLLDKQESWHLLCDGVFDQNSCPLELEKTGKMIAEKCDGLPLTIITVANLLSKIPESHWIHVATQKKHQLFDDAYDEISKLLYPRYENLREDLKLCFLYMGVFPQNCKISKSKLINLWIVEKIIDESYFGTSEICGVEFLQLLALQSFVMIYQRSTMLLDDLTERIKICGLHSSWWHFCYREARKDKFFHILDSYTDASEEMIKGQSRLTIHNNILFAIKAVYKSMEENCAFTTHSLLCLGPHHQYPVPICFGLKLLKKLDALSIRFYQFPLEVLELVKLRYLAITCNASIPPLISKLWKLQYLIVHRHLSMKYGDVSYLPVEIWDMKRLKHLHVTGSDLRDVGDTSLPNLLTLSDVSFNSCTNDIIKGIPNLKKLGIRIDLMPDELEPSYCFDHISHLSELESLKCVIINPTCNSKGVAPLIRLSMFSLSLKKLSLSGLGYPWEEASTISSLPNLEVLKLRNNAFQGPKWVVEDRAFRELVCLIMEDVDLAILTGGYESFSSLRKLSIKHCYNLKSLCLRDEFDLVADCSEVIDCNPEVGREIQRSMLQGSKLPKNISVLSSWDS